MTTSDDTHATPPSIPALVRQAVESPSWTTEKEEYVALTRMSNWQLLSRVYYKNFILSWRANQLLEQRGVPPALRWHRSPRSPEEALVTFEADLFWLRTRYPERLSAASSWQHLQTIDPKKAAPQWHEAVHAKFLSLWDAWEELPNLLRQELKLTTTQRNALFNGGDASVRDFRALLQPGRLHEWKAMLVEYAHGHKDRRGRDKPSTAAAKRVMMHLVHGLTGGNTSNTTKYWNILAGSNLKRQAVDKHLRIIDAVLAGTA